MCLVFSNCHNMFIEEKKYFYKFKILSNSFKVNCILSLIFPLINTYESY